MPIEDNGTENIIIHSATQPDKLTIRIKGDRNRVELGSIKIRQSLIIEVHGSENNIFIGDDCILQGKIQASGGCKIKIGIGTTSEGFYIIAQESRSIEIGQHCMFASGIEIRTSDAHSIYCLETGDRINKGKDVFISEHCWVAAGARIYKGSKISRNTIVGAGTIVTGGHYKENVILAGIPARVVRENVIWDRWMADSISDKNGKFDEFFKNYLPHTEM